jgi:hypothetical protein
MRPFSALPALLSALCLACFAPHAAAQRGDTEAVVGRLLPVGTFTVDAMDLRASPRHAELGARIQAAAQQNAAWLQEQVRRARPGEPLPYDARLGVTREEYAEFLRLSGSMTLAKVASAPLTVREEGRRLVLAGGTAFPDLTGIAIDLDAGSLVTPLGTVPSWEPARSDGARGAMGAWEGIRWNLEDMAPDASEGRIVSLLLGRLQETGRGVFYSELREVRGGRPTARMVRILYFDPPAP